MSPILSILILNYNTKNLTVLCIESIINNYQKELEKGYLEILIGDNASSDSSVTTFKKQFAGYKNILISENKINLGFAKGHNTLAKKARGKYLLFLNSDTQITNTGLKETISYLEKNEGIGILGLKMINKDGSYQASCGSFYNTFNLLIMLLGGERFGLLRSSPDRIQGVDWVSGGAMLVQKELFEKLNGFDENFFMYIEDMELCFRAKKEGYLTYFYPFIKIIHNELGSSNKSYAILNIYKGILYFYKKHSSKSQYFYAKSIFRLKAHIAVIVGAIIGRKSFEQSYKQILLEQ